VILGRGRGRPGWYHLRKGEGSWEGVVSRGEPGKEARSRGARREGQALTVRVSAAEWRRGKGQGQGQGQRRGMMARARARASFAGESGPVGERASRASVAVVDETEFLMSLEEFAILPDGQK